MEKNLSKYKTVEEASKGSYITPTMIDMLVMNNRIPFYSDRGTIMVFPGDITTAINEMFGVEEKKRKKKEPELETPIDTPPTEGIG